MNKINEKRKSLINIGSATVYIEIFVLSAILLGASLFFLKDYDAHRVIFLVRIILIAVATVSLIKWAKLKRAEALLSYDSYDGGVGTEVADKLLDKANIGDGDKVLDIGAGSGILSIAIAGRFKGAKVIMFDYVNTDDEIIAAREGRLTEEEIRNVSRRSGKFLPLPFENGEFDVVVSGFSLHTDEDNRDKSVLIRETLRPLKKGGRFALMDIFNEAYGFKDMDNMLYELENNVVSEISTEYMFRDLEEAEEFKKAGIRDARLIYGVK